MGVHFSVLGISLAVGAMLLRSAKSLVQAKLLSKDERIDPVTLLYYMAPYSALLVMLMAAVTEGRQAANLLVQGAIGSSMDGGSGLPRLVLLLVLSGLNACFLNITGF